MTVKSRAEDARRQREVEEQLRRDIRIQRIQDRLSELHNCLEPNLSEARASGLSLTQWMTAARLRRNEAMASEIRREHTRSLARTILSPAHQTRLRLLQAYLDKVVTGAGYK